MSSALPVTATQRKGPASEERQHRPHVHRDRFSRPPHILVRIRGPELRRFRNGEAAWNVAAERIVCTCLVRDDIGTDVTLHKFRVDVRAIAEEADRERGTACLCVKGHLERLLEISHELVAVAVRHPPTDASLVDLDVEAHALVHLDRERLRAAHAAHPSGQDEPALQGTAEVLPRARRERLVRTLDDPLRADVGPATGRHLPVHREAESLELVERLPVGPLRHEVRVRDQDPRRVPMRPEDRHGLAALHDERLVVPKALERFDDAVERIPVPRSLPRAAVDDELVRLLRVLEVVLEHAQDRFLAPALAPQAGTARGLDPLHADRPYVRRSVKPFPAHRGSAPSYRYRKILWGETTMGSCPWRSPTAG